MKKLVFALLGLAAAPAARAQVEIGLKLSPSITSLRTDAPSSYNFKNESSKFSLGGGVLIDYFFGENYAVSTGLFLTGKGGTFKYNDNVLAVPPGPTVRQQKLAMQYLEVPVSLKLFTNEVAPDVRLYFQVGVSGAVPIAAKINDNKFYTDPATNQETAAYDHVFKVDANVLAGLGAEYQLGQRTKALFGFSYHRGLVDLDRYFEKDRGFQDVSIRNNVFALDVGLKF